MRWESGLRAVVKIEDELCRDTKLSMKGPKGPSTPKFHVCYSPGETQEKVAVISVPLMDPLSKSMSLHDCYNIPPPGKPKPLERT